MASKIGSNLPQEIIVEIASRLPVKSVGKFRCVSKQWRSLLSNPYFIKKHFLNTHQNLQQKCKLLTVNSKNLHVVENITVDSSSRKITLWPELRDNWWRVVGSCHGLVLVINHEYEEYLVNPTTCEQVKIPDPPFALKEWDRLCEVGFLYDSSTNDYKVVRVAGHKDSIVDVYSLKRGVWKRLKNFPHCPLARHAPAAFCDGAIHWLGLDFGGPRLDSVICSFDLAEEKLKFIPIPDGLDNVLIPPWSELVALEGRLCIIYVKTDYEADMWIMKDYVRKESWEKFTIDVPKREHESLYGVFPLCFIGDEELLLRANGRLHIYHLKEKTLSPMVISDGEPAVTPDGRTFNESLLSPNLSN